MFRSSTSGFDFRCNLILCPDVLEKVPDASTGKQGTPRPQSPAIGPPWCPGDPQSRDQWQGGRRLDS